MDILDALQWRYATKKFNAEKVIPEEKIAVLTEAFNLTPTSYGLQPLKLVVIQNQKLQEQLFKYTYKQKQIITASHVLVICVEQNISSEFIVEHFEREKSFRNTPDKILAPYRDYLINFFKSKNDAFVREWAINQAYLALGNLLTVCASLEIDACPMEGFEPKKYDELLKLDEKDLASVLVIPIGYRAEDDMFSEFKKVRRPLEDTILKY